MLGLFFALQAKDGPQEVGSPNSFHPTFQKPRGCVRPADFKGGAFQWVRELKGYKTRKRLHILTHAAHAADQVGVELMLILVTGPHGSTGPT